MKKNLSVFIILFLTGLLLFPSVYKFNEQDKNVSVINNTDNMFIRINSIKTNKNKEFLQIENLGFGFTNKIGYPELPCIRLFVPFNEIYGIIIKDSFIINLKDNIKIYPFQQSIRKTENNAVFSYNDLFYNNADIYPNNTYNIKYVGKIDNRDKYLFEFYPVKWDLKNSRIIVYTDIEIKHSRIDYDFNKYELISEGYLIIMPSYFENSMFSFINLKKIQGYNVKYVYVDTLIDNSKQTIKDVIQLYYNDSAFNLKYVLLIGDTSIIPCYRGTELDNPPTDLYYSLMDTIDYFPDIYIGRFSVEDTLQLNNVVIKNLIYQNQSWLNNIWINKAYFMATDDPTFHLIAEGSHNYAIGKLREISMNVDSMYYFYNSGTAILDAINNGRGIAIYSGHGSEISWAGPPFSKTDITTLTNYYMYPFVFSFACLTGNYAYSEECFGETWIRNDTIGGVGYLGSSVYSYWYEDDIMERALINAYVDSQYVNIADMVDYSKRMVYAAYSGGGLSKRYFEMYNILGDPSLDLFSNIIDTLKIVTDTVIPLNDSIRIYTISNNIPIDSVNIAVLFNDSLIYTGISDNEGYCAIENTFSINDTIFIYAFKHNYKHTFKRIAIQNINFYPDIFSYIYNDTISYYISADSVFSIADSGTFQFNIKNLGLDTIFALSCSLKIKNNTFNANDTVFYFSQIIPNDTAISPHIIASIDAFAEDSQYIEMEYILFDTLSNKRVITKYYAVNAPNIEYDNKILYNDELVSSDTAKFSIRLKNTGTLDEKMLNIRINSPYMIKDSAIIDYIKTDTSIISDTFLLYIPDTITAFSIIKFDIIINDQLGRADTFFDSIYVNRLDYLVIDYDLNNNSGPIIDSLLNVLGYKGDYKTSVQKGELSNYKNIFLLRGVYPDNTFINALDEIANALDSLLKAGKINMYMEGGECWYYDVSLGGFSFNETFGINPIADSEFFSGNIFGINNTWVDSMEFVYNGDNSYLDIIEASSGKNLFIDDNSYYGVCNDGGNYRTVGFSFELGGLTDNASNTKELLLSKIMDYFNRLLNIDEFVYNNNNTFALLSVNPNPFINSANIRFFSPGNKNISIKIYDISGRKVFEKNMQINRYGIHSFKWDNTNVAGIYFLNISDGIKSYKAKLIKLH